MTEADLPERPELENSDFDAAKIDQQNSGSMAGGQQGAAGDGNVQNQGDHNSIGNTIYQLFFGQQSPSDVAARPHDETVLLKSVRTEVADRLSQSLHQAVFINLPKDSQRQRVRRPWDTQIKVGNGEQQTLPPEMSIAEVFKRTEVGHKLLILGEPGAGKTTTLLDLAQGLIQAAEQEKDQPIPVLFNLSSWKHGLQLQSGKQNSKDETQWDSIALWMIRELKSKYGVSNKLAREWLNHKKLLPLLDGLDEVAPENQADCLKAINQFLAGDIVPPGLTVCCREKEYELIVTNANQRLQLNGAICLKPLTEAQLQGYLQETGNSPLWQPIHQDEMLLDLVKTPLWLSVVLLAQRGLNLEDWQNQETEADKKQLLLDAYFMQRIPVNWKDYEEQPRQYLKGKAPTREQTRKWLVILAKQLQEQSEDEFLIENMQPRNWLKPNQQKWQYSLIVGLTFGFAFGFTFGLIFGLTVSRLILGLIVGLIYALIVGPIGGLIGYFYNILAVNTFDFSFLKSAQKIRIVFKFLLEWLIGGLYNISTVDTFDFSFSAQKIGVVLKSLFGWLTASLILSLIFGLIVGLIFGLIDSLISVLISISIIFLVTFLIIGLISGLTKAFKANIQTNVEPNQGIRLSVKNSCFLLVIGFVVALSIRFFAWNSIFSLLGGDLAPLVIAGAMLALIWTSLDQGGGDAVEKHIALRITLYLNGSIPWNYARFLNYCTDRLLLQRVGGRYRFIHKFLQEHFANMPLEK